jgi:5-methylcytosine-specific restriction enzyme subunit McrC
LKEPNYIKEFGVISEGHTISYSENRNELVLDNKTFCDLVDFVEENQLNPDFEKAFTVFKKRGIRCIRVKNYVGVIETTNGVVVEILPKTFKPLENRDASILEARGILFKMLKSLKNSPFINLSSAHVNASKNLPILEVFITWTTGSASGGSAFREPGGRYHQFFWWVVQFWNARPGGYSPLCEDVL